MARLYNYLGRYCSQRIRGVTERALHCTPFGSEGSSTISAEEVSERIIQREVNWE